MEQELLESPTLSRRGARTAYRTRWSAIENVIREVVNGDNLNENCGYDYYPVPNCLHQRRQAKAQAQVNTTQIQLANTQRQLDAARTDCQAELQARQQADQPTRRVEQQLAQLDRQADTLAQRLAQRSDKLQTNVRPL